ncbi:MAG: TIGR00153 family protein [Deltaproteobacteria bacterium]|nr:TIGR00153 family protein [Deltaproteobacteria bacterium]
MLWGLFSQNAFRALQDLMKEVLVAVDGVKHLFEALSVGDQEKVVTIAKEISQTEHRCDEIKQNLRAQISKSVFLPVDKRDLIHVLSHMDSLANVCEDLGVLLTLRRMELPVFLKDPLDELLQRSLDTVGKAKEVIAALDRLLETGFSGHDAVEILKKIDEIDHLEHLADKAGPIW